ncbi:uncharacterized protein N7446_002466 [Penicillium canescens]|uniref:Uncharacterized protein n=1 Tax=Penicillium canescens TaxID=5083 RepID=A0AAD6IE66_PENCN|nr:uncharacterized protein N7446_002466 [Penicillium canescens]KAJ6044270.1 hypothetical protein N7460_005625 [Penicillium canescens]KAJ6074689.1 hypothetical protein N7446_002466 [Penicillium canescens]KAJ6176303.1 hypothetical protein N7485_003217 [Penicillium canescens]
MDFYPGGGGTRAEREMGNSPYKACCAKQDLKQIVFECEMPGVTDFDNPAYPHMESDSGHHWMISPLMLDNILCAFRMSTFEALAEVAIDVITSAGKILAGLNAAVVVAEILDENSLAPQEYFKESVGKGASTARGVSKRYIQKDMKLCKKLDNDDCGFIDKNKDKHKDKNKTATNDKQNPTTTEKDEPTNCEKKLDPTTTDTGKDNCKRAADGGGCSTKHDSTITKWHSELRTISKTCYENHWSQDFYNCYSAGQNHAHIDNWFTCSESHNHDEKRKKRSAVTQWKKQHFSGKE